MEYTKTNWEDAPSTNTPINANNLNHMEEGIYAANTELAELEESVYAPATSYSLGMVMVDGDTITADEDGTIHAVASGIPSSHASVSGSTTVEAGASGNKTFFVTGIPVDAIVTDVTVYIPDTNHIVSRGFFYSYAQDSASTLKATITMFYDATELTAQEVSDGNNTIVANVYYLYNN